MAKYEMGDQTAILFDKILDSDFLALSPASWLNKAFTKRTNSMYGGK